MNYKNENVNKIQTFFDYYKFINKIKGLYPDGEWTDCFSDGQIHSKLWLVDELSKLNKDMGIIFLLGGWYGILAKFLFEVDFKFDVIRSFDIDPECHEIAETINRSYVTDKWKFKATTMDIFDLVYPLHYTTLRRDGSSVELEEYFDTIINTSCEHMDNSWFFKVPAKTFVILQSNDFFEIEEHVNCVTDIGEMKFKFPLSQICYEGELRLNGYTRYMLIGYK